MSFFIRPGTAADLDAIQRIQGESSWEPSAYLDYDLLVAEEHGDVIGFLCSRTVAGESEILNIGVEPSKRRRGVAIGMIENLPKSVIFLEVRESNEAARQLYRKLGFEECGKRRDYYEKPPEDAVVMRLSSSLKRVKS